VVSALRALKFLWMLPESAFGFKALVLDAYLLLYDCLNDDDEEIRDEAAPVVSQALLGYGLDVHPNHMMPTLAKSKLASIICRRFFRSKRLCDESIRRITGFSFGEKGVGISAKQIFQEVREENTALFMVEKQNLYISDVREAAIWSKIAKKLSPDAISANRANFLSNWALEALSLLDATAQSEPDGPLGWCSKSEVFNFGMQVVCIVDVVLYWSLANSSLEVSRERLVQELLSLISGGAQNSLHEMLVDKAKWVLANIARDRLRDTSRKLQFIVGKLR
jgi:hypothetical protein